VEQNPIECQGMKATGRMRAKIRDAVEQIVPVVFRRATYGGRSEVKC